MLDNVVLLFSSVEISEFLHFRYTPPDYLSHKNCYRQHVIFDLVLTLLLNLTNTILQNRMKFVLLVFLFVSTEGRRSVFYLCCERGVCLTMSEYQTDFGFDQPTVRRLERGEGGILSQLEGLDRLDVTFSSSVSAEKETDRPVARLIHLIWLGSPLASKFLPGIRSFVTLNPGEWADTVGPELK